MDNLEKANTQIKNQQASTSAELKEMDVNSVLAKYISGKRCTNCETDFPAKGSGWCKRCCDRYDLLQKIKKNPESILPAILSQVGLTYIEARICHIDDPVRQQLKDAKGDIFMYGPVGVGKTYAMAALLKKYSLEGYICVRIHFESFCSLLRSTMNNNSRLTEEQLVKQMTSVDKLFIDDLGMRSKQETDFAFLTFYRVLNKRQECKLPTMITTNKTIGDLEKTFDSRIASRLSTMTIIHITGEDRRKNK